MTGSKLIDSSVWLGYLLNGNFKDIIEKDEILLLSALSLFEIRKKLLKNKFEKAKIEKSLEFIKKRSLVIDVGPKIAEKAADLSFEHNLPSMDSLIYSSAILNDSILYTIDNDFRKLKGVIIL